MRIYGFVVTFVAAKIYNERKKKNIKVVFDCVTTGNDELFMKLSNKIVIDIRKYYWTKFTKTFECFQHIIDFFKQNAS